MAIGTGVAAISGSKVPATGTLPVEYFETRADGGYAWWVRYALAFDGAAFAVSTAIDLTGAAPGAVLAQWEAGIERIWNDKAALTDGRAVYPIAVDVRFVDRPDADYQVAVHDRPGHSDMLNWYLDTDWGPDYQDELAAHEYGHMIGAFDEYSGGATLGGAVSRGTIMSDLGAAVPLDGFLSIDRHAEALTGIALDLVGAGTVLIPLPPPTPALVVAGTNGRETLWGTAKAEIVDGQKGDDLLYGQGGDDLLRGGFGHDRLRGGAGDDVLQGGYDDDDLQGNDGADWLWGGGGRDRLYGGEGADVFAFTRNAGRDTVYDFDRGEGDRIALADGMGWRAAAGGSGTRLFLDGGGEVLLAGIAMTDVSSDWFFAA